MKKRLRKISKVLIIVMLLILTDLSLVLNCVQATGLTKEKVYEIDYCEKVLKYKGVARGSVYVVYQKDGVECPAYCINPDKIGVGETDSYEVDVNGYITDVLLWRIITNGYPYKSPEELGVANPKEAYLATKQAIYCYLDNRNVNEYSGIGEAGQRTLSALKNIWNNAQSSTETKISNVIDIVPVSSLWGQDNLNSKYISRTYQIQAPAPISKYSIKVNGEKLPEGIKVADTENNQKEVFSEHEQFKILIPVTSLNNSGDFEIKVETEMDTKPVLLGVSPSKDLQSYALTTFTYEDAYGTYFEEYPKNEAQINVFKCEKDTKEPLEGVEFQLLNSDKEAIYQSLITDKNGELIIKDIEPGIYYLREVTTLPGYVLYDEDIEININLNEQINVKVNNTKEKKVEIDKKVTNIEVEETKEVTNIEVEELKEVTNIAIEEIKESANIEKEETSEHIKRLPKTGM